MFSRFDTIPERDGQTDGRTDRETDRIPILYRASALLCWRAIKTANNNVDCRVTEWDFVWDVNTNVSVWWGLCSSLSVRHRGRVQQLTGRVVVQQLTCLTLGCPNGPAYSTRELLNTPQNPDTLRHLPTWRRDIRHRERLDIRTTRGPCTSAAGG